MQELTQSLPIQDLPIEAFEGAAAEVGRRFVECLSRGDAHVAAGCLLIAGGAASCAGPRSPLSAVKGLGPQVRMEDIVAIEEHFDRYQMPTVTLELAPWIPDSTLARIEDRGYRMSAEEFVVYRDLKAVGAGPSTPQSSMATEAIGEASAFVEVMISSFGVPDEEEWRQLFALFFELPDSVSLGVRARGLLAAAAHLFPTGDVAVLGCDGTMPAFRGQGMQAALIQSRLACAMAMDARWAIAEVEPGSASMRNYLRQGFRVAYSRRHWTRQFAAGV